jgi:hypothetical protein
MIDSYILLAQVSAYEDRCQQNLCSRCVLPVCWKIKIRKPPTKLRTCHRLHMPCPTDSASCRSWALLNLSHRVSAPRDEREFSHQRRYPFFRFRLSPVGRVWSTSLLLHFAAHQDLSTYIASADVQIFSLPRHSSHAALTMARAVLPPGCLPCPLLPATDFGIVEGRRALPPLTHH